MKLCPQCEFIYEDDQSLCDMDGEILVHDARGLLLATPPAITGASLTKTRLRTIAVPVAAGLVLSALLLVAYCASSPRLYSRFASRNARSERTGLPQQIAPLANNSSSQPVANPSPSPSPTKPEGASELISPRAEELADRPGSKSGANQTVAKGSDNPLKSNDKRLTIATTLPPLPRLMSPPRLGVSSRLPPKSNEQMSGPTAPQKPGLTNQNAAMTSPKSLIVEVKSTQNKGTKRSAVGTFFKKTARIIRKPFKF
jgi:hypothetical protein